MKSCHICRRFFLEHQMGADYSITTIHKVKVKVSMMTETFCMLNISKFLCKLYWRKFCFPMWHSSVARSSNCNNMFLQETTDKCVHHHVKQTLAVHKHTRYTTMTPTSLWISSQRRSVVGSRASRLWEPVSGSVCRLDRASWHCDWM